jgi:hypothetical protein
VPVGRAIALAGLLLAPACDSPTAPRVPAYQPTEISHFEKLATPPPSMSSGMPTVQPDNVQKWRAPVRVSAAGSPGEDDLAILSAAIDDVRAATGHSIFVDTPGSTSSSIVVHFVSRAEAQRLEPDLQPYHVGYYRAMLSDYEIVSATVVVVADEISERSRQYIVRHELMHAMGFPNHAFDEPTSVMHQPWQGATGYSDLDRAALEMMYRSDISPGMQMADAVRVLTKATVPADR